MIFFFFSRIGAWHIFLSLPFEARSLRRRLGFPDLLEFLDSV